MRPVNRVRRLLGILIFLVVNFPARRNSWRRGTRSSCLLITSYQPDSARYIGLLNGLGENCIEASIHVFSKLLPLTCLAGVSGVFEVRVVIEYNGVAACLVAMEIRRTRPRHLRH